MFTSLGILAEIAVVAGAVATSGVQGGLGDTGTNLYLQISAAVSEAALLAGAAASAPYAVEIMEPDDQEKISAAVLYLWTVLAVIEALEAMNGFGSPDTGAEFRQGYTAGSADIFDLLCSAAPTDWCWSGASAQRYESKNEDQQDRVKRVAAADREIAHILAVQADQVERMRSGLAGIRLTLVGGIGVATALLATCLVLLENYQDEPDPISLATLEAFLTVMLDYVQAASLIAAAGALVLVSILIAEGECNHKKIRSARRKYISVVNDIAANIVSGPAAAVGVPCSVGVVSPASNRHAPISARTDTPGMSTTSHQSIRATHR